GVSIEGYEIHIGHAIGPLRTTLFDLDSGARDGAVSADGVVAGTYVHGVFEHPRPRRALLAALAHGRGFNWTGEGQHAVDPYDALADVLSGALDLTHLPSLVSRVGA